MIEIIKRSDPRLDKLKKVVVSKYPNFQVNTARVVEGGGYRLFISHVDKSKTPVPWKRIHISPSLNIIIVVQTND